MEKVGNVFVFITILLHFYFLVLEMFFWTKPLGLKVFRQSYEKAKDSAALAANQGLYNGFLACGLIWGLLHPNANVGAQINLFFLVCVTVAGVFGALTINKRIFFVQSLPAMLSVAFLLLK